MREKNPKIVDEIERYLRTGDTDFKHTAWSGGVMERVDQAHDDLRSALLHRVHQLARGRSHHPVPDCDMTALTRSKVEPMVRGLLGYATGLTPPLPGGSLDHRSATGSGFTTDRRPHPLTA